MEAQLLALALEELALHSFPGISFEQLCAHLREEHEVHLDPFVKGVLWRSLYRDTDAIFTRASTCGLNPNGADPSGPDKTGVAASPSSRAASLPWREPSIPPDLPIIAPAFPHGRGSKAEEGKPANAGVTPEVAVTCSSEQESCWLLSTTAGIPLRLLAPMDFSNDSADFERRVAEVPFQVLRNVARHKEQGQWQYRIAQELALDPKNVFHHLKPLYREELICHMQLAIPPGHKAFDRRSGSVPLIFGQEGAVPAARGVGRANLTMSALLWSSRFFSPLRLPATVRGLMALHHLLPLQQQAIELLRTAPNNILLEQEVRHFCTSKLLSSEQAPYLRFSGKQVRRLFHRLREALERTGKVRRVRAFCKQTVRYERCLLYSHAEDSCVATKEEPHQAETSKPETGAPGDMIAQVKVEEGTLAATAARVALRDNSCTSAASGAQTAGDGGDDGEDGPSVVLEVEGVSLASLASLLLKAAGSEGVTTVELAHLLGLDTKRSGKILAEFHRRSLVNRVAERRGKCFLYRYISKELPQLGALVAEVSNAGGEEKAAGHEGVADGDSVSPREGADSGLGGESLSSMAPRPSTGHDASGMPPQEPDVSWQQDQRQTETSAPAPPAASSTSHPSAAPHSKQEAGDEAPTSRPAGRPGRKRRATPVAETPADGARVARGGRKRISKAGAARGGSRKRLCTDDSREATQPQTESDPQATAGAAPAAAAPPAESPGAAPVPPAGGSPAGDPSHSAGTASDSKGGGGQAPGTNYLEGRSGHNEEAKALTARQKLPHRTLRLLDTPQFAARLALFKETICSVGCSTIPFISKAIADMEQTANGPDRKTVQRMADVAMQLEPRIRRGRLAPSKTSADRLDEPGGPSSVSGEITFFYWSETHDEASAEQRIAALITQRRAQGCREAIRRNQLLLDGKLKEAGDAFRLASAAAAPSTSQGPDHGSPLPLNGTIRDAAASPEEAGGAASSAVAADDSRKDALVDQQLRGLESEISRLVSLESRSTAGNVMQPGPGATSASLLLVEKVRQRLALDDELLCILKGIEGDGALPQSLIIDINIPAWDKVSFSQKHLSFYGFIFPVMVRAKCFHQYLLSLTLQLREAASASSSSPTNDDWRRLAVSTMIKRMPLESFLRLVGCGYALPMLDEHLAKDSASRQVMHKLPGPLFRLLVFSSRQIQCYRQLHPRAKMPLLGLGKKNAGTAVRKLLSLLSRMGIVSRVPVSHPGGEEVTPQKGAPPVPCWKLHEILKLPAFSTAGAAEGPGAPETKEFDGLSHEGVESFWQQLQLQVSQWMMQEQQQINWAVEGGPDPSQFFFPQSDASEAPDASDKETPETSRAAEALGTPARRRPQPPKGFAVPEAFHSKNWKGQAAMDEFAAKTLEKLRDAGGAELEAVVLNASSPEIAELSARVGYPTDAVLRYLIRVFEIKGGPERNHALLVGGSPRARDPTASGRDGSQCRASMHPDQPIGDAVDAPSGAPANVSIDETTQKTWPVAPTKMEGRDRDRAVGLIVHRTREVRFQCHLCGHFYSWEKSIRLHYHKVHREALPEDEALYVLPWERKRRQEDKQQKAELSKFKRRRRTIVSQRGFTAAEHLDTDRALPPSLGDEGLKASERFMSRLPIRGTVKSVEAPATGFLLRATHDEEAVLASMSREDEIALIGAAIVAERLWQSAYNPHKNSSAPIGSPEKPESRNGPLTEAWLSPNTPQSLPAEDHLIWQILGHLCRPPLAPASARLYVGFVLNRRALNSRLYSSFRRLEPSALRHFVLEGRMPSALEMRVHCLPREESAGPRKSLVCRPLSSPRILMARNILKAILLTPLPFYRPAALFTALRELRPLELNALWRAWQRRGWVTAFKPASVSPPREKREPGSAEPAARQPQHYKRPEIATALESKCRRPFVLSSGSRLSLFGRLRDYRLLSALLDATLALTARTGAPTPAPDPTEVAEYPLGEGSLDGKLQARDEALESIRDDPASDTTNDLLLAQLAQEGQDPEVGGPGEAEVATDADLQLLQLLESDRFDSASLSGVSTAAMPQGPPVSAESKAYGGENFTEPPPCEPEKAVAVLGRVRLPVDASVSAYEVLAALEGLARGRLWLSPFWGTEGRLPDSPEAADDAELLNLLEEEDQLDSRAGGGGAWNDVPEWLSAIKLGREEAGELIPGRPLRKPTEGGIETHITAHAAGVPEITAVTCAVLGGPVKPLVQPKASGKLPAICAGTHAVSSDPGKDEDFSCADVGSICKELGGAFESSRPGPLASHGLLSGDAQTLKDIGTGGRRGHFVKAASHLADGLFGAASELDAFDASLLPPILTDRTSSAAVTFLNTRETDPSPLAAGETKAPLLRPGLSCGFPVSLPTYADDHKQHWRLAVRAAEACAPPGCACFANCGYTSNNKSVADGANTRTSAGCEGQVPCSPVIPCPAFAKTAINGEGLPDIERSSEDAISVLGPIEILVRCLKATSATLQSSSCSKAERCRSGGLSDDICHLPQRLRESVEELARVALSVQAHSLLPLLPAPPLPLASTCVHNAIVKELNMARTPRTFADAPDAPYASGTNEATPSDGAGPPQDLTVCTALTLCAAWILAAVLNGKAEGVAVPDLLGDVSNEAGDAAASEVAGCPLRDAARLSFTFATRTLADAARKENRLHRGTRAPQTRYAPSRRTGTTNTAAWDEAVRSDYSSSAAACAYQLFLVSISLLCRLRLVLPVPAGSCWRLVSAEEAASRFCLKEQPILQDAVAARWASHGRKDQSYMQGEDQTEAARLTSSIGCGGGDNLEKNRSGWDIVDLPSRPAMVPRAIWATWGPAATCDQIFRNGSGEVHSCTPNAEADRSVFGQCRAGLPVSVQDVDCQASNVCGFLSAVLTWKDTKLGDLQPPVGTPHHEQTSTANQLSGRASAVTLGRHLLPMRLASDLHPGCAWMRLDGRLHASLVQLICLRLWGLLMQRPGSTAQQLQGMLSLLDDCEVQLLLHALAEEGIITAAVLWGLPSSARGHGSDLTGNQGGSLCLDAVPDDVSSERERGIESYQGTEAQEDGQASGFENRGFAGATEQTRCQSSQAAQPALSITDYALRVQTIYLPSAVADVLPKFQPFLLPKLSACDCGCSALL